MTAVSTIGWILSLIGGIVIFLGAWASISGTILLPAMVSGLLIMFSAAMLYLRPRLAPLWSVLVIIVSLVDVLGILLFFYTPNAQFFVLIFSAGPLIALIGGVTGLASRPSAGEISKTPAS